MKDWFFSVWLLVLLALTACAPAAPVSKKDEDRLQVLVAEPFLADITRNISGDRANVDSLVPDGVDPHAFEPTPQDVVRISNCDVLVLNGGGLENWAASLLKNLRSSQYVLEASHGLSQRKAAENPQDGHGGEADPHFWLDPILVIRYTENIRDGLILADPDGKDTYTSNAEAYIRQLKDLHAWIQAQVAQVPVENRLLVTNHESFGYFADRYGFKIVGSIIPSVSTEASPSARELADLIDHIRESKAPAIFLETGANLQLARQIEGETGVRVVSDLYTHSIPTAGLSEPGYIGMMKWNVTQIVDALK